MMEEIAVDLMSIQFCAQIVNALKTRIQKIVLKMKKAKILHQIQGQVSHIEAYYI